LEGKIPFDFRKIEAFAKLLNSEIDREAALAIAKQQIEERHRFLLQQDVDRIIDIKTDVILKQIVYLHAPLWFIKYEYNSKDYQLIIEGTGGTAVKGDIPTTRF
jgi:hypothetical protein